MIRSYYGRLFGEWRIGGTRSKEAEYAKQTVEWWYTGHKPWIFFTREELNFSAWDKRGSDEKTSR